MSQSLVAGESKEDKKYFCFFVGQSLTVSIAFFPGILAQYKDFNAWKAAKTALPNVKVSLDRLQDGNNSRQLRYDLTTCRISIAFSVYDCTTCPMFLLMKDKQVLRRSAFS
jgi:hypothetical protein